MVIRVRKYRVFILVAAVSLTVVWYISQDASWAERPALSGLTGLRGYGKLLPDQDTTQAGAFDTKDESQNGSLTNESLEPPAEILHPNAAPALASSTTRTANPSPTTLSSSISTQVDQPEITETPTTTRPDETQIPEAYPGPPKDDTPIDTEPFQYIWSKSAERHPVPSASLIHLPTASPKTIPRIQFAFGPDPPTVKNELQVCREQVQKAMKRTWDGYKKFAWKKDELRPVEGGYKDKFMGWAATLVDSLDTLWIMDMHREFEEAVNATATIDFKQSMQSRIPMFETTIRYLGGLLGAYDISGAEHKVLLDKAVELADVLMGAFDTPNRMPMLYYNFAALSQPDRADQYSCLAEIGSLSVEFTRLAQLTGESRYYDAIARITDGLAAYQSKTSLPGLWPLKIDASGCKHPEPVKLKGPKRPTNETILFDKDKSSFGDDSDSMKPKLDDTRSPEEKLRSEQTSSFAMDAAESVPAKADPDSDGSEPSNTGQSLRDKRRPHPADEVNGSGPHRLESAARRDRIARRQLVEVATTSELNTSDGDDSEADYGADISGTGYSVESNPEKESRECIASGLQSGNFGGTERYTLGGEADSTYEYLPKQYLLLGGNVDQYRTMYEATMDATKKYLLYRPMIEDNKRQLLFTGAFSPFKQVTSASRPSDGLMSSEMSHLACFVGGMMAMGAKIFDRPDELDMAAKVTDACVWAYGVTPSGVMPENFRTLACDRIDSCAWNETAWHLALDPMGTKRDTEAQVPLTEVTKTEAVADSQEGSMPGAPPLKPTVKLDDLEKRQLKGSDPSEVSDYGGAYDSPEPRKHLTHAQFVENRIKNEGLFGGATYIQDRRYILRPEAIESVFYLYRITGKNEWRVKGIKMWMATDSATRTPYGNSAIDDVTTAKPNLLDEMESFWPAETLKYYYLLFSDQDLVNLDDYVLNTEAHPLRRPDAQDRTKGLNRGPNAGAGSPAMQESHGTVDETHIGVAGKPGSAHIGSSKKPPVGKGPRQETP